MKLVRLLDVWKVNSHPLAPVPKGRNVLMMTHAFSLDSSIHYMLEGSSCRCHQNTSRKDILCLENPLRASQQLRKPFYQTHSTPGMLNWADIPAFPLCLSSLAPGLIEETDQMVKILLVKLVESFNVPWPKVLLLVLLNLKPILFSKY